MEQRNEPTTAEIVKAIRSCNASGGCMACREIGIDSDCETLELLAADRLEQLERDLETFKAFHERYAEQTSKKYVTDICALAERAEKAEADRDAAVAEIKESYAFSTGEDGEPIYDFALCLICDKKDKPECDCTSSVGSEFVWRGLRGKDNDEKD